MESLINFYKEDREKKNFWINKEYLVQLNLTGSCSLNCEFCYMSPYKKEYLSLDKIKKLWENLRKYSEENEIEYRVNLTGGDIFEHPNWIEIVKFIAKERSITAVDPLINKFWNRDHFRLLEILGDKINFVQLNSDVVSEEDIKEVRNIGKKIVLKIALYGGSTKKQLDNKLKNKSCCGGSR
ncbi:MAG: radical SAM protein [Candidatus Woesearchaeota archaeon]